MWGITPLDQIYYRIKFRQARFDGSMTPPGLTPHISSPGHVGGSDRGGTSIDADHGVMIVNSATLANYVRLIPRQKANERGIKPTGDGANAADVGGAVAQPGTHYAAEPSRSCPRSVFRARHLPMGI